MRSITIGDWIRTTDPVHPETHVFTGRLDYKHPNKVCFTIYKTIPHFEKYIGTSWTTRPYTVKSYITKRIIRKILGCNTSGRPLNCFEIRPMDSKHYVNLETYINL